MNLLDPRDPRPLHFVGIAGAGMSALAELFVRRGVVVTGCDMSADGTPDLARIGVVMQHGHDPAHVDGARAVVVTSAVARRHPELERARELGIPVIRRAEALGEVTAGRTLVGVAGTHGKSTTTVMTTEALSSAGLDPTALVGGRVAAWGGNLRGGSEDLYVVEADEYDRSFLTLDPTVAVVTNLEADHLDIYTDLDDIRNTFALYASRARFIVLCADDVGANALRTPSTAEVIRYGVESSDARLVASEVAVSGTGVRCTIAYDGKRLGELALRVPGRHNLLNALGAVASGIALGATLEGMAPGLAAFTGVDRRFQPVGDVRGVLVIDDYAHHPTEVTATLAAARAAYPERRLVAAFQPHLYSRTRDFAREFGVALSAADVLLLADIYAAREQPMEGVTSDLIARAVTSAGGRLHWQGARGGLAEELAGVVREGDVVVLMGAGDITRVGPELVQRLGGAR